MATMPPAQSAAKFPSPESYTPKHLAEKILTSKSALEGERKHVTVLFADLKGSMELLADRDPEEARKILDPVLEHMMEAVHRYEGTVNQVLGDGVMPHFGAKWGELRFLAFYDLGHVDDNDVAAGTPSKDFISSAGLGLRFNVKKNFALRADAAYIIDGGGLQENGDVRGNFGMVLSF